ncbi:MAG: V-type ATP synthase subunit D [Pseudomonadota bacterium]
MASLIKVAPTKSNLLKLKRQANFLEEGHTLLERKRELLTRLVYERLGEYRRLRAETHTALKEAYRWLAMAQLRMGSRAIHQVALAMKPAIRVSILPRRSLGVQYPAVTIERLPIQPIGLMDTDVSLDSAHQALAEAVYQLARLAEAEAALGRLIAEQRKTQKRVNALKYNVIPRYHATIRNIRAALEEEERNTLFQIKVLREQRVEA